MAKKEEVQEIFNDIAGKYDLLNRLLSMKIDKIWRRKAMKIVKRTKAKKVLDVACGTGDFAIAAYKAGAQEVVGIDISIDMINIGVKKIEKLGLQNSITLLYGDSEEIDYKDNEFDIVTVAFGVRNFEHLKKGISDMYRVLKPGGQIIILEFSQPKHFPVKQIYNFYFKNILPFIGGKVSGNKKAYKYLYDSVMAFPYGDEFLDIMEECGFSYVEQHQLSFGIASLYIGKKA